jgi:hypothetical protein
LEGRWEERVFPIAQLNAISLFSREIETELGIYVEADTNGRVTAEINRMTTPIPHIKIAKPKGTGNMKWKMIDQEPKEQGTIAIREGWIHWRASVDIEGARGTPFRKQHSGALGWGEPTQCPIQALGSIQIPVEIGETEWEFDWQLRGQRWGRWTLDKNIIAGRQPITLNPRNLRVRRND